MKVSFWSCLHHEVGVTSNMACVSTLAAVLGLGKSVLLENHFSTKDIGHVMLTSDQATCLMENSSYYGKFGMEYILKRLYAGESGQQLIRKAVISLLLPQFYYLPQSYIVNKEVFNYEFEQARSTLFRNLEAFSQHIFIDTESSGNQSTVSILEESDIVVVNMDQRQESWDAFMYHYRELLPKAYFLIGKYVPDCYLDDLKIRRLYHIPADRLGVIPYDLHLGQAMEEGRLIQFVNRNYPRSMDPTIRRTLYSIRKTAEGILQMASQLEEQKN